MKRIANNVRFPYPVLGLEDNMTVSPICVEGELIKIDGFYKIQYLIDLDDDYIAQLIKVGKASFACEVDCSTTFYRKCFLRQSSDLSVEIPEGLVADDFTISITVVANQSLDDYDDPKATQSFRRFAPFIISKGDILATLFYKKYDLESASNVAAFIRLVKNENDEIKYAFYGEDIQIFVPEEMYSTFLKYMNGKKMMPIAMATIINQAILMAIIDMKQFWDNRWARIIRKWVEKSFDQDFDWDSVKHDGIGTKEACDMTSSILSKPHIEGFKLVRSL